MKAIFYLVIQGKKDPRYPHSPRALGDIQVRKKKPATKANEIAVRLELDIPDALFEKPTLQVRAMVPEGDHGPEISTDVQQDIADVIRERTGLQVSITAGTDDQ